MGRVDVARRARARGRSELVLRSPRGGSRKRRWSSV